MRSIYLKELVQYFSSPFFFVLACVFVGVAGVFFYNAVAYANLLATQMSQYQAPGGISVSAVILRPLFMDMSLLVILLVPLISMRLYAEEKAAGTMELLFTYPVSDLKVLLGKYLAGFSVFVLILAFSGFLTALLAVATTPDWGVVLASYTGLILMGGTVLALGVFASSLTGNQTIAAAVTIGGVLVFWALGWFADTVSSGYLGAVLRELSLAGHLSRFFNGLITLKDVVFYLLFAVFFLAVTLRVLDFHRCRG